MKYFLIAILVCIGLQTNAQSRNFSYVNFVFKKPVIVDGTTNRAAQPGVSLEVGDSSLATGQFLIPVTERDSIEPKKRSLFYEKSKNRVWFSDGTKYYRLQIDSTVTP